MNEKQKEILEKELKSVKFGYKVSVTFCILYFVLLPFTLFLSGILLAIAMNSARKKHQRIVDLQLQLAGE
jgi:hypothetical protein